MRPAFALIIAALLAAPADAQRSGSPSISLRIYERETEAGQPRLQINWSCAIDRFLHSGSNVDADPEHYWFLEFFAFRSLDKKPASVMCDLRKTGTIRRGYEGQDDGRRLFEWEDEGFIFYDLIDGQIGMVYVRVWSPTRRDTQGRTKVPSGVSIGTKPPEWSVSFVPYLFTAPTPQR